ncbi:MAG TPA: hypothetical protein VJ777_18490 [Mycobacterium sp.]|nr:hypothetical protein [Mycobacterium sp.]
MPIKDIQNAQEELELAARDMTVLTAPFVGNPALTTLEDATDGSLDVPDYYVAVGLHTKDDGVALGQNIEMVNIRSHGFAGPTRVWANQRDITIGLTPQETNRGNLEKYWGGEWADVTPSAHGGIVLVLPELPLNIRYRSIALAWDDFEGDDIYIYWIMNKTMISNRDNQQAVDNNVLRYPYTMTALYDKVAGSPAAFGICGPGWDSLQTLVATGFGS